MYSKIYIQKSPVLLRGFYILVQVLIISAEASWLSAACHLHAP